MSFGVAGLILGGASTLYSAHQAGKAADDQKKGGDAAIAEDRRQYDQTRDDYAPYRETGGQALASIAQGLGLAGYSAPGSRTPLSYDDWLAANPQHASPDKIARAVGGRIVGATNRADPRAAYNDYVNNFQPAAATPNSTPAGDFNRDFTIADFQKDPGYQFRMDEGRSALEGSAAARTGIQNGRTLRELERYGQDYASGEYSNAYSRFNNDRNTRFNRLATLAGVGQTATNSTAAAGQNASNNVAETMIGQANARAAGRVGEANAINSGIKTLGDYYLESKYGGGGYGGGGYGGGGGSQRYPWDERYPMSSSWPS